MKEKSQNAEPIQQSIHVDCPFEEAFRLFTEGFGEWWPLGAKSKPGGRERRCEIEPGVGGRVLERSGSGVEHEWGTVTAWNPPSKLEFSWNPGGSRDGRQTVSVEFQKDADGTRVSLTHRGWQFAGVAVCVSGRTGPAIKVVQGLAISVAPNWNPVAIGSESSEAELSEGPVGFDTRSQAWRNAMRPTFAAVFLNSFAAFAARQMAAAV